MLKQLVDYLLANNYLLVATDEERTLYKKGSINLLVLNYELDKKMILEFFVSLGDHVVSSQKLTYKDINNFKMQEQTFNNIAIEYLLKQKT